MSVSETQHISMARNSRILAKKPVVLSDKVRTLRAPTYSLESGFRRLRIKFRKIKLAAVTCSEKDIRERLVVGIKELLRSERRN